MLSQIGTKMFQIALIWWFISQFEGQSGKLIGWLLIFGVAPSVLMVRWIGQLVEKSELKSLIIRSDLFAFIVCCTLLVSLALNFKEPWIFFLASFCLSSSQAVIDPAVNKFLPKLSHPEDLNFAVALISSTLTFASFLGALIGAIVIASLGLKGSLIFNAASYLVSCLICLRISTKSDISQSVDEIVGNLSEIIYKHKFFISVMIVFAAINIFLTPVLVTMPLYVKNILDGGAYTLAVMEAFLWAGMLLGSFMTDFTKKYQDVLLVGFVTMTIVGFALIGGAMSQNLWTYGGGMLFIGASLGLMNVRFISMFQEKVPESDKGRFFALLMAVINAFTPIGFLGFGILVDKYSVITLSIAQGLGVIAIGIGFLILRRWRPKTL